MAMKGFSIISMCGAALLLFSSCSNEELTYGNSLPDGEYPLELSAVVVNSDGEVQSRVAENADGSGSVFTTDDVFSIKIANSHIVGSFKYNGAEFEAVTPLYWETKNTATITAWYPAETSVSLSDQSSGLAYVMLATVTDASYLNPVVLGFNHKLAKIRIVPSGSDADKVTAVKIKSYTSCSHTMGENVSGSSEGWIEMKQTTYGGEKCWEANVVPGFAISAFMVNTTEGTLNSSVTPVAGKIHKIAIAVGKPVLTGPNDNGQFTINAGDDVVIRDYNGTAPIVVNGAATVALENVHISSDGSCVQISNNSNVTIEVVGKNNSLTSSTGSGIVGNQNSSITITGGGSDNSKLTIVANQNNGSDRTVGVGFYLDRGGNYGDITIENVELDVTSCNSSGLSDSGAAIGYSATYSWSGAVRCGNLMISNSKVKAVITGKSGAASIGTGNLNTKGDFSMGDIIISNSDITAVATAQYSWKGNNASCIGFGVTEDTGTKTMNKIEINSTTLNLTTQDNLNYKVGKGRTYSTTTITEGIFVDGVFKSSDGWNPE